MKGAICYNESGYFTVSFHAFHLKTLKIIQHDFLTNARKKNKGNRVNRCDSCPGSFTSRANIGFQNIKFPRGGYQRLLPQPKNLFCLIRHGYLMENWLEFTERKH